MRKALLVVAFFNMLAMVGLVFGLSLARGVSWLWITDHAQRLEMAGAVDYAKVGVALRGVPGKAGREELESTMGIDNTRYFGVAATAATVLMVAQTSTLVAIALFSGRRTSVSAPQPAAPAGDVPRG
jgi:hypothetical protein